MRIQPIPDKRV